MDLGGASTYLLRPILSITIYNCYHESEQRRKLSLSEFLTLYTYIFI